ncbi:IclR family transcriptional regulator [Janibacter alittae]|uniref:IclR family transcriptional regulator n=1 Tax=Janibacter alittae TaxID=3115209 RepID=A0ABZ2MHA8_9MICO
MRSADRNDPPISVVGRVSAILSALEDAPGPLGISELSATTGLAKGTVHRLVGQLVDERILKRTQDSRLDLGVRLFELGSRVSLPRTLTDVARPLMDDLHRATGRQIHLAALDGVDVVYVAIVHGGLPLSSSTGGRLPAHATGVGKAMLAYSPRSVVRARVDAGLPAMTPRTIVTPGGLARELQNIRSVGTSYDHEESHPGISCVSAPVFGADKRIRAAISATGQTQQMDLDRLGVAVRTAAFAISRQLRDAGL